MPKYHLHLPPDPGPYLWVFVGAHVICVKGTPWTVEPNYLPPSDAIPIFMQEYVIIDIKPHPIVGELLPGLCLTEFGMYHVYALWDSWNGAMNFAPVVKLEDEIYEFTEVKEPEDA